MIQNIISGIVYPILAGVGLMFLTFVVKIVLPNSAVIAMLTEKKILRAMRYLATIFLLALCWLLLSFSKLFVFSVCLLFAFIVLMLVYDYAEIKLSAINRGLEIDIKTDKEREQIEFEIERCTEELINCNPSKRVLKIKLKKELKSLHARLNSL